MGDAVTQADVGGGRSRARARQQGAGERRRSGHAELVRMLTPELAEQGFDLEDVSITRAGSRSVVRVVVDRDGGVDLDAVAAASRVVSAVLDTADAVAGGAAVTGPYVLEVTSPGVDRPLVAPRHWRRAQGRLVSVRTRDGREIVGRVRASGSDFVELGVQGREAAAGEMVRISFPDVVRAAVQVEFRAIDEDEDENRDAEAER